MPTLEDRLDSLYKEIEIAGRRWWNAAMEFGSCYSTAYEAHTDNLPTRLPPNQAVMVLGKIVDGVAAAGVGVVFSPVTAAIVFVPISMGIDNLATKVGAPVKPKQQTPSMLPQNYQNRLTQHINGRTADYLESVLNLLKVVRGMRPKESPLTEEDVDLTERLVNLSPLMHPPMDYKLWNSNRQLEKEMEKVMWAMWARQIVKVEVGNSKATWNNMKVELDWSKPLERFKYLKVIPGVVPTDQDWGDYKVRAPIALKISAWARKYKPRTICKAKMPPHVQELIMTSWTRWITCETPEQSVGRLVQEAS